MYKNRFEFTERETSTLSHSRINIIFKTFDDFILAVETICVRNFFNVIIMRCCSLVYKLTSTKKRFSRGLVPCQKFEYSRTVPTSGEQ